MLRRRAFTLLEVLMVVALIGIVAGWAMTRVNTASYQVDANVRLLQNVLIGAQQTAITRNVHVQVMIDAANERVRVLLDADNDSEVSVGEKVSYRELSGAQFLTPSSTIDGAAEYYITGPGRLAGRPALQQAIRFAPNGNLSGDVVIYIGTAPGRTRDLRALAVAGATSRTTLWSYATGAWMRRAY